MRSSSCCAPASRRPPWRSRRPAPVARRKPPRRASPPRRSSSSEGRTTSRTASSVPSSPTLTLASSGSALPRLRQGSGCPGGAGVGHGDAAGGRHAPRGQGPAGRGGRLQGLAACASPRRSLQAARKTRASSVAAVSSSTPRRSRPGEHRRGARHPARRGAVFRLTRSATLSRRRPSAGAAATSSRSRATRRRAAGTSAARSRR